MSKSQKEVLKLGLQIASLIFFAGVTWKVTQDNAKGVAENASICRSNKGDIREIKTDIKWLVDSSKRIENKLEK